ncbi:MAG: SUMF1/EgtB/PvdO family nonheme iron enzyme [Polyangiaceae bacterium]|nr:SUMF1/EgtB/PvdO family nonheme iron enzyme [Polyangiaceae bacterium]
MSVVGLEPGAVIGRDFRIVQPLAAGAMGQVYVAEQLSTGKRRALKVMAIELAGDPKHRERFVREARVGAEIDSDHVVEVVTAGIDEATGVPYLVMELLKGEELANRLERTGPLSWAEVAEIMRQTGHALEAAHQKGIVHRDLKPETLFIADSRREGVPFTVKILDFGIAKLVAEHQNQGTQAIGTPLFMSPEQTERAGHITPATDVWPLGLIAFCLLTGTTYWQASESVTQLLREVVVDPIVPASERARVLGVPEGLLPPGFDEWFSHCVNRDVSQRYPDGGAAVRAFLGILPPDVAPLGPTGDYIRAVTARTALGMPAGVTAPAVAAPPGGTQQGGRAATQSTGSAAALAATATPTTAGPSKSRAPLFAVVALVVAGGAGTGIYFATQGGKDGKGGHGGKHSAESAASTPTPPGPSASGASAPTASASAAPFGPESCPEGMVFVKGGKMFMGSKEASADAVPLHKVTLGDFCIDKLEVTAKAYDRCVASGDCARPVTTVVLPKSKEAEPDGRPLDEHKLQKQLDFLSGLCTSGKPDLEEHPINCVDWAMADNFCRSKNGRVAAGGARLPTEAEWEYAARGSGQRTYPWGDEPPDAAHLNSCGTECRKWQRAQRFDDAEDTMFEEDDGFAFTAPVGEFPKGASSGGLLDLAGNVAEWVHDWRGPYTADEQTDPQGPEKGEERVVRGGAFNGAYADWLKPAFRWGTDPQVANHAIGFRCALGPKR